METVAGNNHAFNLHPATPPFAVTLAIVFDETG
jgi:hypothetical protein